MDRKAIVGQLKNVSEESSRILQQMVQFRAEGNDRFGDAVCDYIRCRYLLDRKPETGENIYDLAEESVDIMLSHGYDKMTAIEGESGCTGATSGMMKKVLLMLSLKKALDLDAAEEEFTAIETVGDLIRLCQRQPAA